MGLKPADQSATKRFVRADDEDWIRGNSDLGIEPHPGDYTGDDAWVECHVALNKRDDSIINDNSVSERILGEDGRISLKPPPTGIIDPKAFTIMVVNWSAGPVDVKTYEELDAADAEWVDSCIRRAVGIARGVAEGNSSSPGTAAQPSDSPNSSDEAANQT